ncbi:ubiquinol-cytochrome c reductase iron-sulfur subunit [Stackebrandtia nassauensis]|uniref:Cytochrome bc1 complex Rieske iron-sulfur subunit n=1 Tax=Stackebrandtia nassauensis (strain DSM 44728 / CIP 108903 / NRRL B-16338 / NBRC 102104 / LLR-40K-21) TaxID=446470 RepID=D3Q119_STANL|nr:ubiquinol-cytochrome c reductase iron-sulfur subunit [Stackebrandtia nassauensis]ADD43769.1 Rieske (2Fe-2S) domain protein [Stackebrandtia nassauensis DSM 44728]
MSNDKQHSSDEIDVTDPKLTKFDIVKEGLRRDGIEILHYEPAFPKAGTAEEKRIERFIAFCFTLTGLGALGFVVTYIFWPWEYVEGNASELSKWYTPMLGLCLGVALAGLGIGILTWAKKLLPKEELVQDRHDGGSSEEDRKITGATVSNVVDETGIKRRPMLKRALLFGSAPLGLAAIAPLGALIVPPGDDRDHTGFDAKKYNDGNPVRLILKDGTPVRPDMVSVGGQVTVYPEIPHGTTNKHADSPTLLIHLRDADSKEAAKYIKKNDKKYAESNWNNFFAFSKICTHVGCPASLYEQQTNRLLCPCHQSQFDIIQGAKPIFGPATRSLPQLPIDVGDDGVFYAKSDFLVPVGPAFWERDEK